MDPPDYVPVACLFLCSVIPFRICIREIFWSRVADNLARMAVRYYFFFFHVNLAHGQSKGAGFTSSIISSFFSSSHQCFNSCGSGIKGLNLPIYDVSEGNDVAIMVQPLDFTA